MRGNLYINLIALAISHSDAQWKPFRKNRFECDMVWTQWKANAIPWTTASVMCTESVLCVKSIPPYAVGQAVSPGEKQVVSSTVDPFPGLLPQGKYFWKFFLLSILSMIHMIDLSVVHFPSYEMLNHLQKMPSMLTPELSNASDRPLRWDVLPYNMRRIFALSFFLICTVKAQPSL